VSIGIVVLALIAVRLLWRLTHPVPAEPELPRWQRLGSPAGYLLAFCLVPVSAASGVVFCLWRWWVPSVFGFFPLPASRAPGLAAQGSPAGRAIGGIHEGIVWVLLGVIAIHVLAALVHAFVYRDAVMRRMLFETSQR